MKTLSKTFNIIKSKAEKKLSLSQKTKTTAAKINNNAVNLPTGINIIPQSKENLHKTPILASINNGGVSEQMLNDELKAKIAAELPEVTAEDNGEPNPSPIKLLLNVFILLTPFQIVPGAKPRALLLNVVSKQNRTKWRYCDFA